MGLPLSSIIHGWGLWDGWALLHVVLGYAGAVMAGTLFHIPSACVYLYISIPTCMLLYLCTEVHVYVYLKYIYIYTEVCICWVYTGFLGLENKHVKKQWERNRSGKMSN